MSDFFIIIIPTTPDFIPTAAAQTAGIELAQRLWPNTHNIATETHEHITFIDCGESFESVHCSICGTELELDTWQNLMDQDFSIEKGFKLNTVPMPCCGKSSSVNNLIYTKPMGFSRFTLRLERPEGLVSNQDLSNLESILGCALRIIYQKY